MHTRSSNSRDMKLYGEFRDRPSPGTTAVGGSFGRPVLQLPNMEKSWHQGQRGAKWMQTTCNMASRPNPLPFDETLRDLALIRACEVDLSPLVPNLPARPSGDSGADDIDKSVERSYAFVREARAALKILNREDVEKEGNKIEDIRNKLEDALEGLSEA